MVSKSEDDQGELGAPIKRTMTLNLNDAEMDVLEQLAKEKDLSKTAVLRQALRLYQLVSIRLANGGRIFFSDELEKCELMILD